MNNTVEMIYRISDKNLTEVLDIIKQYETFPNLERITICIGEDSFEKGLNEMIDRKDKHNNKIEHR